MNTQNLSDFGYRELGLAGELLTKYSEGSQYWQNPDDMHIFGLEEIHLEFNPSSGNVFLVDENYSVLMVNDNDKLELWLSCGNCSNEGFKSDIEHFKENGKCRECNHEVF